MQQSDVTVEAQATESEPQEPVCRHHWRIEAPNGATSMGSCKLCGEVREFANSSSDSIWENENSDGGNRWRGRGRGQAAPIADAPSNASETPAPISESALGNLLGAGFRSGGRVE
jgi:hypothetical protein